MIRFYCKLCGEGIDARDELTGRQIKCPKCKSVRVVPDKSLKIKFHCRNCGQKVRVAQIYAGKEAKCPRCNKVIVIPPHLTGSSEDSGIVTLVCSICNEIIHAPEGTIDKFIECPKCGSYVGGLSKDA